MLLGVWCLVLGAWCWVFAEVAKLSQVGRGGGAAGGAEAVLIDEDVRLHLCEALALISRVVTDGPRGVECVHAIIKPALAELQVTVSPQARGAIRAP